MKKFKVEKSSGTKKAKVDISPSVLKETLKHVHKLCEEEAAKSSDKLSSRTYLAEENYREVKEMDKDEVKEAIEQIAIRCAQAIMSGEGLSFNVPSRAASNQSYHPELDRIILKSAFSTRPLANIATTRKTAITTRILELIHGVVSKGIHVTKRDLFYNDVKLFTKQVESDCVLEDVATMIGCTRTSLNVVASDKVLWGGSGMHKFPG
jgi:meiotic recombination protein SPO11